MHVCFRAMCRCAPHLRLAWKASYSERPPGRPEAAAARRQALAETAG